LLLSNYHPQITTVDFIDIIAVGGSGGIIAVAAAIAIAITIAIAIAISAIYVIAVISNVHHHCSILVI
jgi:hypothetical protein